MFQNEQLDALQQCEEYYTVVEEMPQLVGGLANLRGQINYPEMAIRAGIEGRVVVEFLVNPEGHVVTPRVIRGIGGGADEEALRVVRESKFQPGRQNGVAVCVQYQLPIVFTLPE